MKKVIRLTESELHKIIRETVKRIIREDGVMGGGATAGATSASADRVGAYDVPFGAVQRRKGYSPKGKKNINNVDMTPALERHSGEGGSISMNHVEGKKK